MNELEVFKLFYNSARKELVQRIRLRDSVLVLFLAVAGTIFGLALNSAPDNFNILLIIPYLALGSSVIISQHNGVIAHIGKYCVEELQVYADSLTNPVSIPQWDNSESLRKFSRQAINYRTFGHFTLLFIPSFAALAMNWRHSIYSPFPLGIIWWFALLLLIISMLLIIDMHKKRRDFYKKRWEDSL